MAGGKETPRQKLIGLMYLVLLALLALQVSSAIIQKFEFLNGSLEQAVITADQLNKGKLGAIDKAVKDNPRYEPLLTEANKVRKESEEIIAYIEGLKQTVIKETGGKEEGRMVGLTDEDKMARLMVGVEGGKKGQAPELKKKLNDYVKKMNEITGNKYNFQPLALDGKEDPNTKKDPDQNHKDFGELNFEHTPMIAGLAVMSDKQTRVGNMENVVLSDLAGKVGAQDFKFDKISVAVSAKSSTVAAGTDYEADMFITATSSAIVPTMKFRGATLQISPDGKGKIKFKASATNYDKEGNAKQTAPASVSFKGPDGKDTTISQTIEYVVSKPVISVQSAAVSALYLNCGNPLNIQVPALGASYKPSFSAAGAQVITGAEKGQVIIVPSTTNEVSIKVASEGSAIGEVKFPVRKIPRPSIVVKVNGAPVNLKTGLVSPGPAAIQIDAEPEPNFASALPKEARYQVSQGEIVLARGKRPVGSPVQISGGMTSVSNLRGMAQPGDRYVIEVKNVRRKNFRDAIEDVPIPTSASIVVVPIN